MEKPKHHPKPSNKIVPISDLKVISIIKDVINAVGPAELIDMEEKSLRSCHQAVDNLKNALKSILGGNSIIAKSATLSGVSWIGPDCIVGPKCIVGPNSYLRQSVVLTESVRVGFNVEIDTSILFKNVKISHTAFIGSSSLAQNVNAGYGFVTTTGRLNREKIRIKVDTVPPKHIVSTASHHGVVVGAGTMFGAEVITMPGATVAPGLLIEPRKTLSSIYVGSED